VDGQTIVAIIAAVIALGSAGVMIWQVTVGREQAASAWRAANAAETQAREAGRAAKAAEEQVAEARRSAGAAEEQVKAAQDQVALLREQLAAERELRDQQDAPKLRLEASGHSGEECQIIGMVERTPGELNVQMTALQVRPLLPNNAPPVGLPYDPHVRTVMEGSNLIFDVDLVAEQQDAVVEVTFVCTEVGGRGRSWTQKKSFNFASPPTYEVRFV
jgi:hypothetical protein